MLPLALGSVGFELMTFQSHIGCRMIFRITGAGVAQDIRHSFPALGVGLAVL